MEAEGRVVEVVLHDFNWPLDLPIGSMGGLVKDAISKRECCNITAIMGWPQ